MNEFLKAMKDSGIIQRLRDGLPEKDKLEFDKAVEKTLKEYNSMWLETQPTINEYQTRVNKYDDQSKGKPGRNVESSNE